MLTRFDIIIEQSTEALQTLSESYTDLSSLLTNSRSLLSTLVRSQKSDTWYLETAFYILISTIIWLIFRRFLYGPLWWLVWFPLKVFFRVTGSALAEVGLIGAKHTSNTVARTSLVTQSSATGAFPTWPSTEEVPRVVVGGGSKNPSDRIKIYTSVVSTELTMVEKVTKVVEKSEMSESPSTQISEPAQTTRPHEGSEVEAGEAKVKAEEAEVPRNPKKRMWEENQERQKQEERTRDEL